MKVNLNDALEHIASAASASAPPVATDRIRSRARRRHAVRVTAGSVTVLAVGGGTRGGCRAAWTPAGGASGPCGAAVGHILASRRPTAHGHGWRGGVHVREAGAADPGSGGKR